MRAMATCSIWLQICLSPVLLAADKNCHIHPPGEDRNPKAIVGPFSREGCDEANRRYFGGMGRCHCIPGGLREGFFDLFPPDEYQPWRPIRPEQELQGLE